MYDGYYYFNTAIDKKQKMLNNLYSQNKGERKMVFYEGSASFFGVMILLCGTAILGALVFENWKIKWRVWDTSEHIWAVVGGFSIILGLLCLIGGCGRSQPKPTDPVHVEVIVCEPTLGTAGQYYKLSTWCREIAVCATIALGTRNYEVQMIAERYVEQLGEEFDQYIGTGRTDCYCGPVCREAMLFIEEAKSSGLLCRSRGRGR